MECGVHARLKAEPKGSSSSASRVSGTGQFRILHLSSLLDGDLSVYWSAYRGIS